MKQHDNDNEPNPWSAIGLQAALIVNRLRCQAQLTEKQNPPENDERATGDKNSKTAEKQPDDERAYIEHRLRELAAWERKISGRK